MKNSREELAEVLDRSEESFDEQEDDEFDAFFAETQAEKWESGGYVDHCKDCSGEDCVCCQYWEGNER